MSKPIYVLGTGLSHDGSACLLKDGKIVVAIEKERITRRKHDGANDSAAINYCMQSQGISWDDVSLVVQNTTAGMFEYGNGWFHGKRNIPEHVKVISISHHLAHAYCAYFSSPFTESKILVLDAYGNCAEDCIDSKETGRGRFETVSIYDAKGNQVTCTSKQFGDFDVFPASDYPMRGTAKDSIGVIYETASAYVFGESSDLGELMGLSSYGINDVLPGSIFRSEDGKLRTNYGWINELKDRPSSREDFINRFQYFADVAKFVQTNINEAILDLFNSITLDQENTNLCYSGGLALNCVTNSFAVRNSRYKNVYIHPVSNDAGLSIGCAYYGWHTVLGNEKTDSGWSVYSGMGYDRYYEDVLTMLRQAVPSIDISQPKNINVVAAKLLAKREVIGWYKGGAEMGQRALGHRSLLGNPCDPGMKDRINNTIKNRPDFRPFAPSVLAEDAAVYFDIDRPSPHMLMVFPVREEWRDQIPAVTHVDGTARVQTVSETDDKDFYELLKEVKRETGIGMVLNTSFNRRHEPIVETPHEAVQMFLDTPMDALVLGPYLLTK